MDTGASIFQQPQGAPQDKLGNQELPGQQLPSAHPPKPGGRESPQKPGEAPRIPSVQAQQHNATEYQNYARSFAEGLGLPPALVLAIMHRENPDFDPYARGANGEIGLMQIMPAIAKKFGVKDRTDPYANMQGGISFLHYLWVKYKGDIPTVVAAYNAGETAVDKYRGIPPYPKVHDYVNSVLSRVQNHMLGGPKPQHTMPIPSDIPPRPHDTIGPSPAHNPVDWLIRAEHSVFAQPTDANDQQIEGLTEAAMQAHIPPLLGVADLGALQTIFGPKVDEFMKGLRPDDWLTSRDLANKALGDLNSPLATSLRPVARAIEAADIPFFSAPNAFLRAYNEDPKHPVDAFMKGSFVQGIKKLIADPGSAGIVLDDWGSMYGMNSPAEIHYWAKQPGVMERIEAAKPTTDLGKAWQMMLGMHANLARLKNAHPVLTGMETTGLELLNPVWYLPQLAHITVGRPLSVAARSVRQGALGSELASRVDKAATFLAKVRATVPFGDRWAEVHNRFGWEGEAHAADTTDFHTLLPTLIAEGDKDSGGIINATYLGGLSAEEQNLILPPMFEGKKPIDPKYADRINALRALQEAAQQPLKDEMPLTVAADDAVLGLWKKQEAAKQEAAKAAHEVHQAEQVGVQIQQRQEKLQQAYSAFAQLSSSPAPNRRLIAMTKKYIAATEQDIQRLQEKYMSLPQLQQMLRYAQEKSDYLQTQYAAPFENMFEEPKSDYAGTKTQTPAGPGRGRATAGERGVHETYTDKLEAGLKIKKGKMWSAAWVQHLARLRRAYHTFKTVLSWEHLKVQTGPGVKGHVVPPVKGSVPGKWVDDHYTQAGKVEELFVNDLLPFAGVTPSKVDPLRAGGIDEPLILGFDPKENVAVLAEGRHRLHAAIKAGYDRVPVRALRMNLKDSDLQGTKPRPVKVTATPDKYGHVGTDYKPSAAIGIRVAGPLESRPASTRPWSGLEPIHYDFTDPQGHIVDAEGKPLTFGVGPEGYKNMKKNLEDVARQYAHQEAVLRAGEGADALLVKKIEEDLLPENVKRIEASVRQLHDKRLPEHSFSMAETLKIPDLNGYAGHQALLDNLIDSNPGYNGRARHNLPSPFQAQEPELDSISRTMSVLNALLRQLYLFSWHFHPTFNLAPIGIAEAANIDKPWMAKGMFQAMMGAVPKQWIADMEKEIGASAPKFGANLGLSMDQQMKFVTEPYMKYAAERAKTLYGHLNSPAQFSELGHDVWGLTGNFAGLLVKALLNYNHAQQKAVFQVWEHQMSAVQYYYFRKKLGLSVAESKRRIRKKYGDYNNLGRVERAAPWIKELSWFYSWFRTQAKNFAGYLVKHPKEVFAPVAGIWRANQQQAQGGGPVPTLTSITWGKTKNGEWRVVSVPGVTAHEGVEEFDLAAGSLSAAEGLFRFQDPATKALIPSGGPALALRTGISMTTSRANLPGYLLFGALETNAARASEPTPVGATLFNRSPAVPSEDQSWSILATLGRRFIPQVFKSALGASRHDDPDGVALSFAGANVHYEPGNTKLKRKLSSAANRALSTIVSDEHLPLEIRRRVEQKVQQYEMGDNQAGRYLAQLMKTYSKIQSQAKGP